MLSIVTIVKHNSPALRHTLNSIRSQPSLSLVVVDYEYTLCNKLICDEFENLKGIATTYKVQSSPGIFGALNDGLAGVASDWVVFMNAGDLFAPTAFSSIDKVLSSHLVYCVDSIVFQATILDPSGSSLGSNPPFWPRCELLFRFLLRFLPSSFWPCHQSILFRVNAHKANLYQLLPIGADQEVIKLFLDKPTLFISESLSCIDTSGVSSRGPRSLRELLSHSKASFELRQFRRLIVNIIKYFVNITFSSRLIYSIRALRYRLFFPLFHLFLLGVDCLLTRFPLSRTRLFFAPK